MWYTKKEDFFISSFFIFLGWWAGVLAGGVLIVYDVSINLRAVKAAVS